MGLRFGPRSIRGKLLFVFVLAVAPALCLQTADEIHEYCAAREAHVDRLKAVAAVVAGSLEVELARLKNQERTQAKSLAAGPPPWTSTRARRVSFGNGQSTQLQRELSPVSPAEAPLPPGSIGSTAISGIHPDADKPAFLIITPIRFAGGDAGRLTTRVSCALLADHIRAIQVAGNWRVCALTSPGGSIVVHGRKASTTVQRSNLTRMLQVDDAGGVRADPCPVCEVESVGAVRNVPGTDWQVLVLDAAAGGATGAAGQVHWLTWSIAAVVLGLAVIFSMGNRMAHPIRRLALAAGAIAVGDYRKRANIRTGDELESLGKSFNALGESLVKHQETAREQSAMLAGMVEAARVSSSSIDIRECGKAVARAVCNYLEAQGAAVYWKDTVNGGVKPIGHFGAPQRAAWKRLGAHAADSASYLVISEQSANLATASETDALLVGVPLSAGAETPGAIVARYEGNVQRADLQTGSLKADVLCAFGVHAAAAIRNAEVHSQTERYSEVLEDWVEHLSSVMRVTDAISPSLDLHEVLAALARDTAVVLHTDQCAIFLPDEQGYLAVRECWGLCKDLYQAVRIPPGKSITGKAYAQKRYVACADAAAAKDPLARKIAEATGLRALLSSPLIVEDRAIGAITVGSCQPRKFTPREIQLLTSISLHAAVIVRNASLYTKEVSIADTLQKGLASEVPNQCRGLRFAARYIPAMDEARVGGDFYDVASLPNGKVAVVMGDVSGKGLSAAIHLAACKYMLKSLIYAYPDDPAEALGKLNEALNHYYDLSFFVTLFCAVIDPVQSTIRYANAGHPPGLLVTTDRRMHVCLPYTGTPVGSGLECRYRTGVVDVERSDLLLLYTDGVTDVVKDGRMLGVEGLHSVLFEAMPRSPAQLVDYLCDHLNSGPESSCRDDFAVLAVSFEGVAARKITTGGRSERKHCLEAQAV